MDRNAQIKLLDKIITDDTEIDLSVWRPPVNHIKVILNMGHTKVRRNSQQADCTIFNVDFEDEITVTLFCDEAGAKFMRKYYKERKEVNN